MRDRTLYPASQEGCGTLVVADKPLATHLQPSARHTTVLLLEDDAADALLVEKALAKTVSKYEVAVFGTLGEAVGALGSGSFDVILSDLSLPDSHGLETLADLRNADESTAIIALTSLDDELTAVQSLEQGAQDYLVKGQATPRLLDRSIRYAIQRQKAQVEARELLEKVECGRELLEKKNQRLKKLYQMAHEFVDNVSHEFRTPLTVIKDYVSLVREGIAGPVNDEQSGMLDTALVRVDDLTNMVDDMLDVSKLESGLLGAWRRNCRLADIVHSVRPALDKKAEVRKILFDTAVDQNLPEVYGDSEKIGRVIINLVTNAMKFCGEPGIVRLWAEYHSENHEIVIGVTDNGPGIDAEELSEIFGRFKQLQNDRKNSTKGFGLGLSIAKELVDLNFGEMHVDSAPGKGSTFSFTVPVAEPLEVMRRYLERAHRLADDASVVSLVRAQIDLAEATTRSDDADAFFNYLLHPNDLLFRSGNRQWLFVVSAAPSEVHELEARAQRELERANRNRPRGPLPSFEMTVAGSWRVSACRDEILDQFTALMHQEPVQLGREPNGDPSLER